MRADRAISKRIRDMLAKDKIDVGEGFTVALDMDVKKLLSDYFEIDGRVNVNIIPEEGGDYRVTVEARATRIKQFDTTYDIRRY